jgi:DNA-binding MarR family transcriptional regulator
VGRCALAELSQRSLIVTQSEGGGTSADRRLTPAGDQIAAKLVDERRASLVRLCEGWSPDQNPELGELITRIAHELAREQAVEVGAPA